MPGNSAGPVPMAIIHCSASEERRVAEVTYTDRRMSIRKNIYSKDFRDRAVRLLTKRGAGINQAATELGI